MARPKSKDTMKLSARLIFRLTAEEMKALQDFSKVCGKPVSVIIRDKAIKGKYPKAKAPRLDVQTYTELKKIGVNLNQLARVANSGRNLIPMEFYKILMQLKAQLDLIIAKLL
jgi:hypothetical protein